MLEKHSHDLVATCDCCGEESDPLGENFMEARYNMQNSGWITKKIKGEWLHFCGEECAEEYRESSPC